MKAVRTILNFLVYIAIVGGIVWGLPQFLSWKFGTPYPIAAITSGSMWPILHEGDLIFIRAVPKNELNVGDVVVWQNDKGFTIHRIVKLEEKRLVTKGDANFKNDEPVAYAEVVGRTLVWSENKPVRIPYLGFISVFGAQALGSQTP